MTYDVEVIEVAQLETAVVREHVSHDGIGEFLGRAFGEVLEAVGQGGVAGPPFARYVMTDEGWEIEGGFPVHARFAGAGRVEGSTLPGGMVARTVHSGSYLELGQAYAALEAWLASHGYVATGAPWEVYVDEPTVDNPRTLVLSPCTPA
jgi:effector-binding domain-containing protein